MKINEIVLFSFYSGVWCRFCNNKVLSKSQFKVANLSHSNIQVLTDKLSALFNVKMKKSVALSAGNATRASDEKKAFFDEQFKIIMKKIKEAVPEKSSR
jgi:hypothetical protein